MNNTRIVQKCRYTTKYVIHGIVQKNKYRIWQHQIHVTGTRVAQASRYRSSVSAFGGGEISTPDASGCDGGGIATRSTAITDTTLRHKFLLHVFRLDATKRFYNVSTTFPQCHNMPTER